jgi:hypothetical protein
MSFGTDTTFKSKKALREAVEASAPNTIMVFDTSAFNNRGTVSIDSLADSSAMIVGPDVYNKRSWYAQVKIKNGKIVIV